MAPAKITAKYKPTDEDFFNYLRVVTARRPTAAQSEVVCEAACKWAAMGPREKHRYTKRQLKAKKLITPQRLTPEEKLQQRAKAKHRPKRKPGAKSPSKDDKPKAKKLKKE